MLFGLLPLASVLLLHFLGFIFFFQKSVPVLVGLEAVSSLSFSLLSYIVVSSICARFLLIPVERFFLPYARLIYISLARQSRRAARRKVDETAKRRRSLVKSDRTVEKENSIDWQGPPDARKFFRRALRVTRLIRILVKEDSALHRIGRTLLLSVLLFIVAYLGPASAGLALLAILGLCISVLWAHASFLLLFSVSLLVLMSFKAGHDKYMASLSWRYRFQLALRKTNDAGSRRGGRINLSKGFASNYSGILLAASAFIIGYARADHVVRESMFELSFPNASINREAMVFSIVARLDHGVLGTWQGKRELVFLTYDSGFIAESVRD